MTSFSLLDEGWIPCLTTRNETVELGLRETLARAHDLQIISHASPLVTVALHRLLLAVLHRVYDTSSNDAWARLWTEHHFDPGPLNHYLETYADRFDLFSKTHPFGQAADLAPKEDPDAYKLVLELSPSTPALFAHVDPKHPPALSPAEAARALVAYQAFNPGGLVAKRVGAGPTSSKAGPLAGAAVCLIRGGSLHETLLLNLVRYDGKQQPFPVQHDRVDAPAWERDMPPGDQEREPIGYLDWLTWQSRCVRLFPDQDDGQIVVRRARITKGNGLPAATSKQPFETMVGFRHHPDAKPPMPDWTPVSLQRERAVWRDSTALIQSTADHARPRTLDQVAERMLEGWIDEERAVPLDIYGVAFEQANALFWRSEQLPFPLRYLEDGALYAQVERAVRFAEAVAWSVRLSVRHLAAFLLGLNADAPLKKKQRETLDARTASLGGEYSFWALTGPYFSRFLHAAVRDPDDALHAWADQVERAAWDAYREVEQALGESSGALRTCVEGGRRLGAGIAHARKQQAIPAQQKDEESA